MRRADELEAALDRAALVRWWYEARSNERTEGGKVERVFAGRIKFENQTARTIYDVRIRIVTGAHELFALDLERAAYGDVHDETYWRSWPIR